MLAPLDPASRAKANADILVWQSKIRIVFVLLTWALGAILRMAGLMQDSPRFVAGLAGLYVLVILGLSLWAQSRGRAGRVELALTVAADLAFYYVAAYYASGEEYYERALFFSLFTVELTGFFFGRTAAVLTCAASVASYAVLVWFGRRRMVPLELGEELWHIGTYLVVAGVFLLIYSTFVERLTHLARLFQKLEGGDFATPYDEDADPRPDGITLVGRAYNRVRSQLAGTVTTDPVSGCLNQRGFDQQMRRETERAFREGNELGVVVIDIDRFSKVNERIGRFAADKVLRDFGRLLRDTARTWDSVGRPTDDQFVILVPESGLAGAREVASRVKDALAAREFRAADVKIKLRVSMGVAANKMVEANVDRDLLSRAEEALERAKMNGGDRIEVAE